MMSQEKIRVTTIGHIANQVLRRSPSGLVTGTTSRGIYLQPREDLTLYLTSEPFRGPLTVNIRDESSQFPSIQPFDVADLLDDTMKFKVSQQAISFHRPLIWRPARLPSMGKAMPDGYGGILHQIQAFKPDHPYLPLLEMVINEEPMPLEDLPGIEDQVLKLAESLSSGNPSDIIAGMVSILGIGPGLTPLGDDLLLGILLAKSRARREMHWSGDLIHFYHTLLSAAEEKTTRVSWSLLSCAVQGTADERIIRILDGLIAGREIPDHDLESLLDWGSSSGMAVLAGMLMVLS